MRLFYNILLFYCILNLSSFIISSANIFPTVNVALPWQSEGQIQGLFSIGAFEAITGLAGGLAIGIIGFLLKQGVYATFAVVIFVFGVVFKPIQLFFTSLPNALGLLAGADAAYLVAAILGIVSLAAFWFLVELLTQRFMT